MLSTAQPPERRSSPLLSNNPFRNRAVSPNSLGSPSSPSFPTTSGPSKNPFLDNSEPATMATTSSSNAGPHKSSLSSSAVDLLGSLSLDEKKPLPPVNGSGRRPENAPPRPEKRMPPPGQRPSRSREEEERRRRQQRAPKTSDQLDIFADPSSQKSRDRRPRRNSDTSVMDQGSKSLETEEERRRRKHKEREARRREGSRHGSSKSKANYRLDVIDKLDVTSIFGTGVFHHDGPFDACNPNRNKKGIRAAPMAAFPKDSVNMAIGGSGPVNKDINHAQFHGFGAEGYNDFATSAAPVDEAKAAFNASLKAEPVHGDESMGLGTSTFLEGAPASKLAIQRTEQENEYGMGMNGPGGLGRKKSLAQRIRGISNNRPGAGRIGSPEQSYGLGRSGSTTSPPLPTSLSLGTGSAKLTESNPFFQDYDKEYERKGAKISVAESAGGRARAISSPRRETPTLERTMTNDSIGGGEASKTAPPLPEVPKSGGGGFLNRVKSLKGGPRRPRQRED